MYKYNPIAHDSLLLLIAPTLLGAYNGIGVCEVRGEAEHLGEGVSLYRMSVVRRLRQWRVTIVAKRFAWLYHYPYLIKSLNLSTVRFASLKILLRTLGWRIFPE